MRSSKRKLSQSQAATYQIQLQGRLSETWSDWFDYAEIVYTENEDGPTITTLTGKLQDQAALHGLLGRIRDLCIPLLSVKLIDPALLVFRE